MIMEGPLDCFIHKPYDLTPEKFPVVEKKPKDHLGRGI
jgi:hypothetical protein